jgi:hypothetical protein
MDKAAWQGRGQNHAIGLCTYKNCRLGTWAFPMVFNQYTFSKPSRIMQAMAVKSRRERRPVTHPHELLHAKTHEILVGIKNTTS